MKNRMSLMGWCILINAATQDSEVGEPFEKEFCCLGSKAKSCLKNNIKKHINKNRMSCDLMKKLLTFSPLGNTKGVSLIHWVMIGIRIVYDLIFKMYVFQSGNNVKTAIHLVQEPSLILSTVSVSSIFYQTNDCLNLIFDWIFPFLNVS